MCGALGSCMAWFPGLADSFDVLPRCFTPTVPVDGIRIPRTARLTSMFPLQVQVAATTCWILLLLNKTPALLDIPVEKDCMYLNFSDILRYLRRTYE